MVFEIWKALPEYPYYKVSNAGRVIKLNKGSWTECHYSKDKKGYITISVRNSRGEFTSIGVHRLVAMAFCKKPENEISLVVNHLDENPSNNRADNLEWITQGENVAYSIRRNTKRRWNRDGVPKYSYAGPAVNQYDLSCNLIKQWASVKEAALTLKIPYSNIFSICVCMEDIRRPVGGFWWAKAKEGLPKLVLEHKTKWQIENEVRNVCFD